jgi:4-amino-4-deoxy-L-arabinose transferase-like glycosyltransferase
MASEVWVLDRREGVVSKYFHFLNQRRILIIFIIMLALAARLYNINAPLVGFHAWRQADTMTIAQNFYANGYNLLLPQIDWGGNTPGYVEAEFPIYQYILSLVFIASGVSEFFGRLLSIFFSLSAILVFYKITKKLSDEKTAQWAAFLAAILPLAVFMSRAIMPESLLLLSIICGIYFFIEWLDDERTADFFLSILFVTIACLIKPPSLYMGLPLGYLAWLKYKSRLFLQWKFWAFGVVIFLALFLWYDHAHQLYLQSGLTFGIWDYQTDKWGKWWLLGTSNYWVTIFGRYIGLLVFAGFGYPVFIAGLFLKRRTKREYFFDFWLAAIFIYFLVVNQGNLWHFYYQLPFVFPAAYFMGKVFGRYFTMANKKQFVLLAGTLALLIFSSAYVYIAVLMSKENPRLSNTYELAGLIQARTKPDELVVVLDNGDPSILYLAKRKGWHGYVESNLAQNLGLGQKISQGAQYFAGDFISCRNSIEADCDTLNEIINQYPVVLRNDRYFIVDLTQ